MLQMEAINFLFFRFFFFEEIPVSEDLDENQDVEVRDR